MSEWNLSVRLTGQGSSLTRTLRDVASDARSASSEVNALRRNLTLLRTEASNNIRVRLDVDADHLRNDVNAALTSAGAGQGLGVRLRVTDTMQLRRDVNDAIRWAVMGQRIQIPLVLADSMQLRRDVSDAVRWASMNQTITVRVRADTSGLLGTLNGPSSGGSGGGLQDQLKGLLLLAPALIPLTAGLTAELAPLAAGLGASGVAGAAFGIALAGQIGPLSDAAEALQKYDKAVTQHGAASKEAQQAAQEYRLQIASLPPDTQRAAVAIAGLKGNFQDWSDSVAGFTMDPVTRSIAVLDKVIPHLTPEVKSASIQLDRLVTVAGGAVSTPGFDAMSDRFAKFTDQQLDEMTDKVMHFMRLLSEGKATSGPIGEFMAYARENGPAAREAIKAISDAVVTLMRGASEAGPSMLTLVTAAARLVAALPPELVGIILQVATALKLLQLSGAGMAALAGGITRVRTAIIGLSAASAAAGGGIAGLRAAFLSLGTAAKASLVVAGIAAIAVVLMQLSENSRTAPPDVDRLTGSLARLGKTGKATGEAAKAFGTDLGGLYDRVRALTDPSTTDNVQQFLVGWTGWDSTPVADAKKNIDAIDKSLAGLVKNGQADLAAAALKKLMAEYAKGGRDTGEITKRLDDYKAAIADAKFEQELAAASMGLFGKAAQDTQTKLEAQKKSADGLRQSIQALNDVNRAGAGAMNAFEQSIDDATKAAKSGAGALKMHNGELDLGSQKSRDAESALRGLAASTDDAAAKAREQGKSWEYVQGIMTRGQKAFVDTAQKMGLTETQAEALAKSYLDIPSSKTTTFQMRTEDAITQLDNVAAAIKKTPDKKSVTVDALTIDAVSMLESLGFTVTHLKDGRFKVTADTSTVGGSLEAVESARDGLKDKTIKIGAATSAAVQSLQQVQNKIKGTNGKTITMKAPTGAAIKALEALGFKVHQVPGSKKVTITIPTGSARGAVSAIQGYINSVHGKTVTVRINGVATGVKASDYYSQGPHKNANGGVWDYYAEGGVRAPRMQKFASGGENHVAQIARAGDWRMWAEPETGGEGYVPFALSKRPRSRKITEEIVRRLGGDPSTVQWNADGNVTDWRYDPSTGSLYSASDAGAAGHKTKKVKVKGKTKSVDYFDIGAVEKKLKSAAKATTAWNKDLEKVADRAGGDVAEALAAMGEDGMKIAHKMATGSTKYINEMSKALRDLQKTAKASLSDYTRQLGSANKLNKEFSDDLATLAAQGFGDLASQLAAQNDEAAHQLAAAAVKDKGKASKANKEAKTANNALTADDVSELVSIIAAISSSKTGIHDVAAASGLGEDEIIAVATKATSQIKKSLGGRAARFLADLAKAQKGMAYADGGIRSGIYATRGGAVTFAEPSTGGEAYIPLGASKRRSALPVLADVAGRFGVGLKDANAGRVVVIREQGPLVGTQNWHVTSGTAADTARRIDADNSYQLRRLQRGGVATR